MAPFMCGQRACQRTRFRIVGANHSDKWHSDIQTRSLDAFFVCEPEGECVGRWLGQAGPAVRGDILTFLKSCGVYGNAGMLSQSNAGASEDAPVRHGRLFTGLHLETNAPKMLLTLVCGMTSRQRARETPKSQPQSKLSSKRAPDRGRRVC